MVYTAIADTPVTLYNTAVGIARNLTPGSMARWVDLGYYRTTEKPIADFSSLEGPIMMPDMGTPTGWICMFSNASNSAAGETSARFQRQSPGFAPQDTSLLSPSSAVVWPSTSPGTLYAYEGSDPTVYGWNGTEYLKLDDQVQWLAGFTAWGPEATGIEIARVHWNTTGSGREFSIASSAITAVDFEGSPTIGVRLRTIESRPGAHRISWRISAPSDMQMQLDVYDVAGRRQRRLLDGRVLAGSTVITWDTANGEGDPVRSGVYFVRLNFDGGARVAVVPIAR